MNRRFRAGLVVGKFSPLHRGHETVIQTAQAQCDQVFVISYSKPEFAGCGPAQRSAWFDMLFPQVKHLAVNDEALAQWRDIPGAHEFPVLPRNDDAEKTHRRFCAWICRQVFRQPVDAVFTSETYGEGFAAELTASFREFDADAAVVTHMLVDLQRAVIPISATKIRQDVHAMREWLSPAVYASFVKRVCLLGGESSGKSTLARLLAEAFETRHVDEYGRELWERQHGVLVYEDMTRIAETQTSREQAALPESYRYLFCDTSPLTTLFYSRHLFGKASAELEASAARPYDVILLCAPDFPFAQDGTRQDADFRQKQHDWYLAELSRRNILFHLVSGTLGERLRCVRSILRDEP